MRTVVVTGVAGSVGSRVAELLGGEGASVVGIDLPEAVGRASSPGLPASRAVDLPEAVGGARGDVGSPGAGQVRLVGLDLAADEAAALDELVAGADALVHLAWRIPEGPGSPRQYRRVNEANRLALERVLSAASRAGTQQVVVVSSATVYGAWPDNPVPLSEDAPLRPNPGFAFAAGKADADRRASEWAGRHPGVATAILRPAVTVGGAPRPLYQALGAIRAPRGADGSRPVQYLHVDDLASAVLVVLAGRLSGVFNVAPDTGIREDTARALSGGLARLALPARLAGAVATWSWELWRSGIPRAALPYAVNPWVVASDRLRGQGWRPRYTSEEALVATDPRAHWDDLPPGRRQNYTVAAAGSGALLALGAGVAGFLAWLRRHRAR